MKTPDNQELEDLDDLQFHLHLDTLELHWHLLNPDLDLGLEKALKLERNLSQVMGFRTDDETDSNALASASSLGAIAFVRTLPGAHTNVGTGNAGPG